MSRGITGSGWISGVFGWISGVGLELWVCPRPNGGGEEHPSRSPFCALNIFRAQNGLREGCSSPPPLGRGQTHNSSPTPEIQPNTPEIQPDPVIPLDNQTSSKQVLPLTTSPREDSAAKPYFPSGKWLSISYPFHIYQSIFPTHKQTFPYTQTNPSPTQTNRQKCRLGHNNISALKYCTLAYKLSTTHTALGLLYTRRRKPHPISQNLLFIQTKIFTQHKTKHSDIYNLPQSELQAKAASSAAPRPTDSVLRSVANLVVLKATHNKCMC